MPAIVADGAPGHAVFLPCGHVCWHGTDHWCPGHAAGWNQWEDAFAELWDTQLETEERAAAVAQRERAVREREEAVVERERAVAEAERERRETARSRLLGSFGRLRLP